MEIPKLKSSFHCEVVGSDLVFLLNESRYWVLSGKLYANLLPLIDGKRNFEQIALDAGGKLSLPEVYFGLENLIRRGYVVEANASIPDHVDAYWSSMDLDVPKTVERIATMRVDVTCVGRIPESAQRAMASALNQLGACVTYGAVADADVRVVLVDDYTHPRLNDINKAMLRQGKPWLIIKPIGNVVWIGPLLVPGQTACWECMHQRIKNNRHVESFIQRRKGDTDPLPVSRSAMPATEAIAINMATIELAKWMAGKSAQIVGSLMTYDTINSQLNQHSIVRRPQCQACGDAEQRGGHFPDKIQLQPRPKIFTADGGHRSATPEQTLKKYSHHISPITGVVTNLDSLDEDDNGVMYSYIAGHNFAMMNDDLHFLYKNMRGRSGGKGRTQIQAKVSGLCEAIERYSGVYRADEYRIRSTYNSLGSTAIPTDSYLLYSDAQYQNRAAWNAALKTTYHIVPNPMKRDWELDWTPAWSLTDPGRMKFVPTAYVYYGHPELKEHTFCACDANGCASGNYLEEAILQGFLEIVERDAVSLWWYNEIQREAVDLDSFNEPYFGTLTEYYRRMNRDLWVLDITSDLGIPTFVGVSRRTDRDVEDIVVGFGSHLDPKIGVMRALTEVNQFMPSVIRQNPDGSTQYFFDDEDAKHWWKTAKVVNQRYLLPKPGAKPKKAQDYPVLVGNDLKADVETCVDMARQHGLETYVIDMTRPDVGLSVARVIVPNARHFWRRLAPGRLYDVPVQMGWLNAPKQEQALNPYSVFF